MRKKTYIRVAMRKWGENYGMQEDQTLRNLLEHLRYSGIVEYDWGEKEEPLLVQWLYPFPDQGFATTHVKKRLESFGDRVEVVRSENPPLLYRSENERIKKESDE
jgi:hypothetical protein